MAAPEEQSWLGRGHEDVPGKPLGWAHHQERDEIRAHLAKRLGPVKPRSFAFFEREQLVNKIQYRLRKYRPTLAQRQASWRARQPPPPPAPVIFTEDELAHIAEHFAGANDPLAQEIWRKAARRDSKGG